MARTTAKAQLSRMQIVEEEKRHVHPATSQSFQTNTSNSSLSGSGSFTGSLSGSVPASRSAGSTLIRTLPEPQNCSRSLNLVLPSSGPSPNATIQQSQEDAQSNPVLTGLAHPTPFHLNQLEKKQQQHHHIRSLLIDSNVPAQAAGSVNVVSIRGDGLHDNIRATASTNSPNGMGSSDHIEDLELACLTSEIIGDADINRIEPTFTYAGPTGSSAIEQHELFNNMQHRSATGVLEAFPAGNSGGALATSIGANASGSQPRRSAPSSLPARFNFGSTPMGVPPRQTSGASVLTSAGASGNGMPAVVGSAESGSGAALGGGGGQGSSRAASRSSLMIAEEEGSNSAEMKQRQKKDQHNKVERKRREQINHFIALLGEMLPKKMFEGNSDNKKNKGTVLRKTTELIEKLTEDNRDLRNLLRRSCDMLHALYPIITAGMENNTVNMGQEDLNNYVDLLQALAMKDRQESLAEGCGPSMAELSPSSATSCPPADTPMSMHPPTPSGLTAVPENSNASALSGSIAPSSNLAQLVRAGDGQSLLLSNARSAPSSLSTNFFSSRSHIVKEEDSEMFSSHHLTHVEPAELHTLLAQISSPHSKTEPHDGPFSQLGGDNNTLNAPSPSFSNLPMAFMEDMDTNDGVSTGNLMSNLENSEGMDM